MSTTQDTVTTPTPAKVIIGNFGNGRFSPAMGELFKDAQRLLSFSAEQAHVTAVRLGVDAGQLSAGKVEIKYGKSISKDGKRTLKEVTQGIKVTNSWALSIGSVCAQLDDARKSGLEVVECTMNDAIMEFVSDAVAKLNV